MKIVLNGAKYKKARAQNDYMAQEPRTHITTFSKGSPYPIVFVSHTFSKLLFVVKFSQLRNSYK